MIFFLRYLFLFFCIFFISSGKAVESNWSVEKESKVRLISPLSSNNYKSEIFIGLEYELKDGWKTYWQSPGEGGFPQEIKWNNSKNIKSLEILWPLPKNFEITGIQSIGYENKVIFPLKIILENPNQNTSIILDINYLTCKDICIPGNAFLELNLPSGKGQLSKYSNQLERVLSAMPTDSVDINYIENIDTKIFKDDEHISFYLSIFSKKKFINPSIFLHTSHGLPVVSPSIKLSNNNSNLEAIFQFDKSLISQNKIETKFIISDKNKNFEINEIILSSEEKINLNNNYLFYLLIAFIGGIILNAMPCVFPVLSIKVLTFLNHVEEPFLVRRSFIVTSLGIIFSFILLAFFFLTLRYLGVSIGWGMQFQQPIFLLFISYVLAFFSLNLLGFYEIPIPSFVNFKFFKNFKYQKNIKDFFNGFFATLMATPCSAPFIGTAITAAFTQSFYMMYLIFMFMGLGMAFPYLLVAAFPNVILYFPKPGKWMIYLKYILGLLLFATLIWVGNILLNHFNYYLIVIFIILLIVIVFFNYFFKAKRTIIFLSLVIFFILPNFSIFKANQTIIESDWVDFNTVNIKELVSKEKIVFIDITADWCATCQYNKINVLNSNQIEKLFTKYEVIKVKGDWTKPNTKIEKFLQKNNRYGIPFNIIYSKNNPEGIILSEILTKKEVLETIQKIK